MDKIKVIYNDIFDHSWKSRIFWTGIGSAVILAAQYLGVLGLLD